MWTGTHHLPVVVPVAVVEVEDDKVREDDDGQAAPGPPELIGRGGGLSSTLLREPQRPSAHTMTHIEHRQRLRAPKCVRSGG